MLTETQQGAITSPGSAAVIASAGSGKTRVLTERYAHLLSVENIPAHALLVFTFTEKAALEIRNRILKKGLIPPENQASLQISTLHSFCARVLRRYGAVIGLNPDFRLLTEAESHLWMQQTLRPFLKTQLAAGQEALTELARQFGFDRTHALLESLLQEPRLFASPPSKKILEGENGFLIKVALNCNALWRQEKIGKGVLNFDDLETLTLDLLRTCEPIRQKIIQRYRHILVDEFQDTNPTQGELIDLLHEPGTNSLFIVGDPKQSIYRFRKADARIFHEHASRLTDRGGHFWNLEQTFRIPRGLAQKINRIFDPLFGETPEKKYAPLVSQIEAPHDKLHVFISSHEKMKAAESRILEARFIAKRLAEQGLSPEQLEETALLFRSSQAMPVYQQALEDQGIPCTITRSTSLLKSPLVSDVRLILAYLAGETTPIIQVGLMRSRFFQLSETFIEERIKIHPSAFLTDPFTPSFFTKPEDVEKFETLVRGLKKWESLKKILNPVDLFSIILKDLGFDPVNSAYPIELEQWIQLLEDFNRNEKGSLMALHQRIGALVEEAPVGLLQLAPPHGCVRLMTIHAAKGLEFDRVFLPQLYASIRADSPTHLFDSQLGLGLKKEKAGGLEGFKLTLEPTPLFEQIQEETAKAEREEAKNLLYVAMTRAKDELFVFLKDVGKKKINPVTSKNWNEWITFFLAEETVHATRL